MSKIPVQLRASIGALCERTAHMQVLDVPPELPHLARRFSSARPVRQKRPPVVRRDEEEGRLERLRRLEDARAARKQMRANPGPTGSRHR